jgi:hypothetical protein
VSIFPRHSVGWLEVAWIVVPTLLVLTMFFYGLAGFRFLRNPPEGAMVVDVQAVPIDKPIEVKISSEDVIHSFLAVPPEQFSKWYKGEAVEISGVSSPIGPPGGEELISQFGCARTFALTFTTTIGTSWPATPTSCPLSEGKSATGSWRISSTTSKSFSSEQPRFLSKVKCSQNRGKAQTQSISRVSAKSTSDGYRLAKHRGYTFSWKIDGG